MTIPIVGIIGKARSGKDVAGGVLAMAGFYRAGLADQIAVVYGAIVGLAPYELDKDDARHRAGLQDVGLATRDEDLPDFWIGCLESQMMMIRRVAHAVRPNHLPKGFYVPNIRFPNEAAWVQYKSGKLLGVTGRGGLDGLAGEHETEAHVEGLLKVCDVVVENSSTVDAFKVAVAGAVRPWLAEWGIRI